MTTTSYTILAWSGDAANRLPLAAILSTVGDSMKRLVLRSLTAVVALTLPLMSARAQSSQSGASVSDVTPTGTVRYCSQVSSGAGPSSATCPPTNVPGGKGSASSAAVPATRSVTSTVQFTQGAATSRHSETFANTIWNSGLNVSGFTGNQDLVFHFLLNVSGGFTGGVGTTSYAFDILSLLGPFSTTSAMYQFYADGTQSTVLDPGAASTPGGLDITEHVDPYSTGFLPFGVIERSATEFLGDQSAGVAANASLSAILQSIEIVDLDSGTRQTATWNPDGTATYTGTVTTPEPATLAFLAPGLFAIAGLVRRRRRDSYDAAVDG
jgi:hypothetical protein